MIFYLLLLLVAVAQCTPRTEVKGYTIHVHTGDRKYAGTNANVYLTIFGELGTTAEQQLDTPNYDDFERGDHDVFDIFDIGVGEIQKIRIRHDNTGPKPGWYLEDLTVDVPADNISVDFPCNWWLSSDEAGGIDRVLSPGESCQP